MQQVINRRQLAEYSIRPMGLTPEMQTRMIRRLCRRTDFQLMTNFTKSCGIGLEIIGSGKFVFKY